MIDLSWILNRGRAFLGQHVTGPLDFSDADMLKCLNEETLPTLSIYLPWLEDFVVDTTADMVDPRRPGIYQIRTNARIIGINRLRDSSASTGNMLYDPYMHGDVLDRQMVADRQSASEISFTWKFMPPNVVEVFPKSVGLSNLTFELRLVHPPHLRTIPMGARESLRDLFLADLATDVVATRSYFSSLQSIHGEVQLNLDGLRAQADRRADIVEKLAERQLKSAGAIRVYIA